MIVSLIVVNGSTKIQEYGELMIRVTVTLLLAMVSHRYQFITTRLVNAEVSHVRPQSGTAAYYAASVVGRGPPLLSLYILCLMKNRETRRRNGGS